MTKHLVWVVLAGLLLAGCPDTPGGGSDVDAQRLAALKSEPVLKLAVGQPYAETGFRVSDKLPLHRSKVTADLTKPADAGKDQQRAVEAIQVLRNSGWTVFHARCADDFTVAAYKVVDRVSFYAQIDGSDVQDGQNAVLRMRAPHSGESKSDLFPERPPALEAGKTCLETNSTGGSDGTLIVLDELAPGPGGEEKPTGHR